MTGSLAFTVMGKNFGFENVTISAVIPGFFVGATATFIILLLIANSRAKLVTRLAEQEKILEALRAEISRSNRLEVTLEETDERHRVITETVPSGILVHLEGKVLYANPVALEMYGAGSEADFDGVDITDLVHPDEREYVLSLRRTRFGAVPGDREMYRVRRLRLDGSVFWSEGFARGIRFAGEDAILVAIHDVSERMAAETALQFSQKRFQDFAEASADWFWETDASLRFTYMSQSVARIVGAPPEWHYGKTRQDLLGDQYDRDVWDKHFADLEARRPFRGFEYFRVGDGEVKPIWIRASGQPIYDERGMFLGYRGSASDITEQKEAEERLRASEELLARAQKLEAVGQLTGGIAHDFNNLLAVIQGNAEFVSDLLGSDNEHTKAILRAANRGAELTQRLLAFSRQQPLQPRPTEVAKLVSGMVGLLQRTLGEAVEIETAIQDDLVPVMADPGQLENALLNLAINARDAMPSGGRLAIECRYVHVDEAYHREEPDAEVGDHVVLSVSDTGTGMSADVQAKAFDPFFTTKDVGEGSGLGLSMVYGFARQSGGHVTIYSEEQVGTTVRIYLPVARDAVRDEPLAEILDVPSGQGESILVIEDDPDVRALAVQILQDLGYAVDAVPDAARAEHALAGGKLPDLILSDVVLPGGVSGPVFAETARARYPGIRIIFMSGYPEAAAKRNGFLGSDSVLLNKPFQRRELAKAVRAALA
ncbi:MAG: PAS domain S-box protein [Proteobacteria bacterium]|nr:PAS domain S-box protein [Pseudomonadota bacterium]